MRPLTATAVVLLLTACGTSTATPETPAAPTPAPTVVETATPDVEPRAELRLGGQDCDEQRTTDQLDDGVTWTLIDRACDDDGPWIIHHVHIAPDQLHRVANVLAGGELDGTLSVPDIAAQEDALVAVNGGYLLLPDGPPRGVTMVDGELLVGQGMSPKEGRVWVEYTTSLLLHDDGTPQITQVTADADYGYVRTRDGHVPDTVVGVVNGGPGLVEDGYRHVRQLEEGFGHWAADRAPRTVAGIDPDGGLMLVLIEGRHDDSVGASIPETADVMVDLGAVDATNLDGGYSSALAIDGEKVTTTKSRPVADAIVVR